MYSIDCGIAKTARSESWYHQVKEQRWYDFYDLGQLEAKVEIAVSLMEDVPSAALNLYMLYQGGITGGAQLIVALLSLF